MFGEHLIGIYEKALDPALSWEQRLKTAKALGFDYLELSVDEADERIGRLYWPPERVEALRRLCAELDMPILSMCLSAHRRFPFGSADPEVSEKARDIMTRALDLAARLGIRTIQLAGYDVYYEPSTPESAAAFRAAMDWAAEQAERRSVMLAMEIMDTPFMNSITKHMEYERAIASPWYKVYPDLGNLSAWPENDVDSELELGRGSIVAVHLKDTLAVSEGFPGKFKCVPFGSGCVDFPACFARLERQGYRGPYMVEMWHGDGADDADDAAEISRALSWLRQRYDEAMKKEIYVGDKKMVEYT